MSSDETIIRSSLEANALTVPGIVLSAVLGRGGMAIVYEGLDQGFSPPRRVAVKLMNTEISTDPEFRARFEHEASLVAGFRHDNIVRVYSCGEVQGTKYIIMEYLPGGTLAERIDRDGPLAATEIARAGAQLADALCYAHERGIVHRDFKPGNVLFTADGKPVLSDFGVAKSVKAADAGLTRHASVIGAPRYMAPEQERGDPVSDRSDVYSFGLTLYEMFTAALPPTRERVLQTLDEGASIRQKLVAVAPSIAELICQCLLANPERRPSARECARELSSATLLKDSPIVAARSRGNARQVRWAIGAGALILVAAVTAVAWLHQGPEPQKAKQLMSAGTPSSEGFRGLRPVTTEVPRTATADTSSGNLGAQLTGEITLACGSGAPESLRDAAISEGLRAKVQLTLGADTAAQREAAATLKHELACLTSLARAGVTSADGDNLLREADGLLKHREN